MAYKTISILGTPTIKEYTANAAITPGHLVEVMSTGKVRVHATGGGTAQTMFALEDENQGKEIGDAYSSDNVCRVGIFRPGDEVFGLLYNGENAAIGNFLESQGDGTLRVVDVDSAFSDIGIKSVIGIALEAVDMSDSSAADPSPRIRVEVM
jgi:hypothetical protein